MRDDIGMTTGNSQDSGSPDITDLGNDVYQTDTRMAGYQGITAGYLIRSSRPCPVETGTSTSAPVAQAALRLARGGGVRQRTVPRYRSLAPEADPEVAGKFERLSGAAAHVSGMWHWLDRREEQAA
jgi:hypothetical protein